MTAKQSKCSTNDQLSLPRGSRPWPFTTRPLVLTKSRIRATDVFNTYWRFAAERQSVFFRRVCGALPPWTSDPILLRFRFTNAYRAADRVSQFLIRQVQGQRASAQR